MQRFESEEAREAAERKARLENPEGDDGFVTVTYKRKRGRNSGNPAEGEGVRTDGGAKKKKKGAGELQDFYRFQVWFGDQSSYAFFDASGAPVVRGIDALSPYLYKHMWCCLSETSFLILGARRN